MATKTKPFLSHTAADLMIPVVVTIPQDATVGAAAALLQEHAVSGLPVVDREGRCVGVLSAADFVRIWARGERSDVQVREVMTPDPVTGDLNTSITDLSRMMIDARIHRVIVTDEDAKPIGIVSSTNILAAVIYKSQSLR
jgi:IMP dehydrogenase